MKSDIRLEIEAEADKKFLTLADNGFYTVKQTVKEKVSQNALTTNGRRQEGRRQMTFLLFCIKEATSNRGNNDVSMSCDQHQ